MKFPLTETTPFLESLFQNVSDGILVIDKDGAIIAANHAFEALSGYSTEELIHNLNLCQVCIGMATCSEDMTCVECFAKRQKMPSFEMFVRTKNGAQIPVAASSTRLPTDGLGALVLILRDITEQQRMERERHQRQLTNYVIQAQEEERKRISRDLHDGIGQALYSILVGLRVVNQLPLEPAYKEHLDEVQKLTSRTLEEVKSLSVELRPSALDDLGLVPAVRSYLKRFEETFGIETTLTVVGQRRRYATTVETALYRILQEAMTNSAKYADTDQLAITLTDQDDQIEICIEDSGVGFDPEHLRIKGTGLGLFGMRERASLLGGTVKIDSAPGAGTRIGVTIPLDEKGGPKHVHSFVDRR
ncbi:histidine kinase [Tumebacillus algifaecis]|uniref:Sensor histidine kinase n=1 Tax=Tumebacillus algifaecis TaxID=1214604 RepID=A0A223CXN4_9BACL|nr:PAS domain-containing sensor histidine kinase [Tumebacillus algifaecis]ASS74129.1 histidine kinase [Tumebacillus algifaecis]